MFCPNCGTEIREGASFCTNCGTRVAYDAGAENKGPEIDPLANGTDDSQNAQTAAPGPVYSEKSKLGAGLLGIFLGGLGVHNFYLGYTGKAVAQLLLSLLTCGALSFVSQVWGLVEGIMILSGSIDRDAQGKLLKD